MRHARSTTEMEKVRQGTILPSDRGETVIIKAGRLHPDGDGSFAWRVVVHTLPGNDLHPFAVHDLHYDDEASSTGRRPWVFGSGAYCQTIEDALAAFHARAGV
jgi:hypothetical protein